MEGEFSWNDRYAGDEAWFEWFRICSVAGCGTEVSDRLRAEISSAMFAHLSRAGVSREAAELALGVRELPEVRKFVQRLSTLLIQAAAAASAQRISIPKPRLPFEFENPINLLKE